MLPSSSLGLSLFRFFLGAGEAQDGDGDRQAELTRTIAALRKDVADAQKQAAQEAGHVAQYRSLAEGAEENTRIVQVCMTFCAHGLDASRAHI